MPDPQTTPGYLHLRSGLPSRDALVLDLLKIRASRETPEGGRESARWAEEAVDKIQPLRHSIALLTPYGEVELVAGSLEALDWSRRVLDGEI